jgi:hypothetical protein
MEPGQIFIITLAALITGCITLSTFAEAWGKSRRRHGAAELTPHLDAIESRLGRLEQSIDSIAIEMERIAEAQRFTSKLLADQVPLKPAQIARAAPQGDPRLTTPH